MQSLFIYKKKYDVILICNIPRFVCIWYTKAIVYEGFRLNLDKSMDIINFGSLLTTSEVSICSYAFWGNLGICKNRLLPKINPPNQVELVLIPDILSTKTFLLVDGKYSLMVVFLLLFEWKNDKRSWLQDYDLLMLMLLLMFNMLHLGWHLSDNWCFLTP